MDNGFVKFLLVIFIIAYIISPVDFAPGPIDDIAVMWLGSRGLLA